MTQRESPSTAAEIIQKDPCPGCTQCLAIINSCTALKQLLLRRLRSRNFSSASTSPGYRNGGGTQRPIISPLINEVTFIGSCTLTIVGRIDMLVRYSFTRERQRRKGRSKFNYPKWWSFARKRPSFPGCRLSTDFYIGDLPPPPEHYTVSQSSNIYIHIYI